MKKVNPRDVNIINALLISDYEKSASFLTIKNLIKYLKTSKCSLVTFFHDIFDKEIIEELKNNRLNKKFDMIIISLTKNNLLNLMTYGFYKNAFNNKVTIFIFGAKSALIDVKYKYKNNILCYERRGVSKTSQQFIDDIVLFIIQKKGSSYNE